MSSGNIDLNRGLIFSEIALNEKVINLNHEIEFLQEKNLNMAKKIHNFLQTTQDLTLKQKSIHCKSQRVFMKLYLNKIYNRIVFNKVLSEESE